MTVCGKVDPIPNGAAQSAAFGDFDKDGYIDLYVAQQETWERNNSTPYPDLIYHNVKGKGFKIIWTAEGQNIVPGRGAICADFNEDGAIDIYVSNYRMAPNWLWMNKGDGTFDEKGAELKAAGNPGPQTSYNNGVHNPAHGHTIGSCCGDFDNDGHFDILVGNFSHAAPYQDRPQFLRNLGPEGDWAFEDKSRSPSLSKSAHATW